VTEGKGDKAGQSRDSLLTQNHRPKKRRRRSPTFDSGRGAKRSRSSRPAAPSVGRGPPPMNDDNQYVVECLRERRNRGRMIEYLSNGKDTERQITAGLKRLISIVATTVGEGFGRDLVREYANRSYTSRVVVIGRIASTV
jgi:hypothetical protein